MQYYKYIPIRLHLKNVVFAVHLPCFQNLPALLIFFSQEINLEKKKIFLPTYPDFFLLLLYIHVYQNTFFAKYLW